MKNIFIKFSMWLHKLFYSIIGFILVKKLSKNKDLYLYKEDKNICKTYKYTSNKTFIVNIQAMEPTSGVVVYKEDKIKLSYWTVGCLYKNNIYKITELKK